ncbi:MAG: serine hydrolase [Deltaproteobacteria bacterium]|nr:serine hydrolase [Deltaproteobacteria bacterium]
MHKAQDIILAMVLGAALLSGCGPKRNTTPCPLTPAETTSGWDVRNLDDAFQFACELGTTTLIVATNGEVVRSMGDLATPHRVHSVRKALLSALVGQHMGMGPMQINLESTLAELGIDDEPHPLTRQLKEAKVLHLIKSVSGINHAAAAEGGLMQKEKDRRLGQAPNIPGTKWAYNNWDYNALTTIFVEETGLSVYEAFKEGIADPLGMQDFGNAGMGDGHKYINRMII